MFEKVDKSERKGVVRRQRLVDETLILVDL